VTQGCPYMVSGPFWVSVTTANVPVMAEDDPHYRASYQNWVRRLRKQSKNVPTAMEQAVGGDFEQMGLLQRELLIAVGLQPDDFLIDVGCGSGRLAVQLADYLKGSYLGTDVIPDLLEHAASLVDRPDWRFEVVNELMIPSGDETAELVCFFSVMTHLRHEESYRYLQEARRVLRVGGKIVFSFLDFAVEGHWHIFEVNLRNIGNGDHLNQFIDPAAIPIWAEHLDLTLEAIYSMDVPHIPLSEAALPKITAREGNLGWIGQSVAVLVR
jgi:SAM-dependent methyltransferase